MSQLQSWVDDFAWRLAADPELGDTFVRADFTKLKRQMLRLTCSITNGQCEYDLDKLAAAHKKLTITGDEVERFLEIARASAVAVGLPKKPRGELLDRLRSLAPQIRTDRTNRVGSEP